MTIIECVGVTKSFAGKSVLRGVDLAIEPGQVVGLLGKNGSGKSTLIKCLFGLLRVDSGTARVFGDDAWDLSSRTKSRIGYVPQEVQCYPWMRVEQIVDYTAAFYPNWDREFAAELVRRWDLPLKDRVGPLSPGQTQMLGLVLALGHRPDLVVLDEPVASLDPVARREFLRTLLELVQDEERSVLFSTHITSDLERVADRVALLREGRIEFCGELDVLKDHVKRVRLTSDRELPASFSVRGALRCEVSGRSALIALPKVSDDLLNELKSTWRGDVAVEDLSLEDIFLELHHER